MKVLIYILISIAFLSCLEKDNYINVPKETDGVIYMLMDSGISLKSTIKRDTFDHLDTGSMKCLNVKFDNVKSHELYVVRYHGIQLRKNGRNYFYSVMGALSAYVPHNDSNTLIVNSHIGIARLNISDPENLIPTEFKFIAPADPPRIESCIYESVLQPAGFLNQKYYMLCPKHTDKVIYGWETGIIKNPKCYAYD